MLDVGHAHNRLLCLSPGGETFPIRDEKPSGSAEAFNAYEPNAGDRGPRQVAKQMRAPAFWSFFAAITSVTLSDLQLQRSSVLPSSFHWESGFL